MVICRSNPALEPRDIMREIYCLILKFVNRSNHTALLYTGNDNTGSCVHIRVRWHDASRSNGLNGPLCKNLSTVKSTCS